MHPVLTALMLYLAVALPGAHAEPQLAAPVSADSPLLKVINFTAKWCATCRVLDPLLEETLAQFDTRTVEKIDLDKTYAGRRSAPTARAEALSKARALAEVHKVGELWRRHSDLTGVAVIVSADTGEVLSCIDRSLSPRQIRARLERAKILSLRRAPGQRTPARLDCPAGFLG